MFNCRFPAISFVTIALFLSNAHAWKKEAHVISVPIIEGLGIYSSIRVLQDSRSEFTKASAISSLALLTTNAAMGSYIVFGPQTDYALKRSIHKYIGYAVTAAALWMSVSAGNDARIENSDKNIFHCYTLTTSIPIIVFSF
jgi:hypothetical protein